MIKKVVVIIVMAYVLFILEMVINDVFGMWAKPELLLLSVIFWGLYSGIRYSIVAALVGGLLRDIVSILPFGTHLVVYIAAAYLTTWVRRNLYQPGSSFSRVVVAFFVLLGSFLVELILYLTQHEEGRAGSFFNIFLSQLVTTMVVSTYVFYRMRDIAFWFKL